MSQRLTMPFARQMMLCGYKTVPYRAAHGYDHYGIDVSTIQGGAGADYTVYASGDGEVVAAGFDNSVGNVIVMIYRDVYNHRTGEVCDLVARYAHLAAISVKAGDVVRRGMALGVEGKSQTKDYHLHLEFETDVDWPLYSPQVSSRDDALTPAQGNILRKGKTDTTVNPSFVLHVGAEQRVVKPTYNPAWLNAEDFEIPTLPDGETTEGEEAPAEVEISRKKWDELCSHLMAAMEIMTRNQ